ncbi:MAG: riboflavin synthase [Gammaproteobacteria bacterium]|jgi:riboflavin synthase
MFTGIIQAVGSIGASTAMGGDIRLSIDVANLDMASVELGDSIAVNGVCLTAIEIDSSGFAADVSQETLDKTSLGKLQVNSPVNLEKSLTLNTALGGHLVSGHVDGLAELTSLQADARSIRYRFEVEPKLQHYIAEKGSVTIDGTSLTVNGVDGNCFDVNIVPHTQQNTIFQHYQVGSRVNLEVDIIARYLERLIQGRATTSLNDEKHLVQSLIDSGFIEK